MIYMMTEAFSCHKMTCVFSCYKPVLFTVMIGAFYCYKPVLYALNYITSDVFSCYKYELFAMMYIVTAKLVLFVMYFLVRSSTMWEELF